MEAAEVWNKLILFLLCCPAFCPLTHSLARHILKRNGKYWINVCSWHLIAGVYWNFILVALFFACSMRLWKRLMDVWCVFYGCFCCRPTSITSHKLNFLYPNDFYRVLWGLIYFGFIKRHWVELWVTFKNLI